MGCSSKRRGGFGMGENAKSKKNRRTALFLLRPAEKDGTIKIYGAVSKWL